MKGRLMPAVRTPTFSHYQSLRRENPDLFYKLSTQRQMRDSYVTLGAAFFDAYAQQVRL
ncbi:hypothetical protein N9632_00715 [bacterium]|nr:hypothetical protein [bacterium]